MDTGAGCQKEDRAEVQVDEIKKTVEELRAKNVFLNQRVEQLEALIESANAFVLQKLDKVSGRR